MQAMNAHELAKKHCTARVYTASYPINASDPEGTGPLEDMAAYAAQQFGPFVVNAPKGTQAVARYLPRLAGPARLASGGSMGPYVFGAVVLYEVGDFLGDTLPPIRSGPLTGSARPPSGPITIPLPGGSSSGPRPTPLTRGQQGLLDRLKNGEDVTTDITTARRLLENTGLEPFTEQSHGDRPAPAGTFRGDLLNTQNPSANYIHPPGSAPRTHHPPCLTTTSTFGTARNRLSYSNDEART